MLIKFSLSVYVRKISRSQKLQSEPAPIKVQRIQATTAIIVALIGLISACVGSIGVELIKRGYVELPPAVERLEETKQ